MNDFPKRKKLRLENFDYSNNGAYYITMCTQNRANLFGEIKNGKCLLNAAGKMVENHLLRINDDNFKVDKYCIMPNHIHIIIIIYKKSETEITEELPKKIKEFKTITTRNYINEVKNGIYPRFDKKIWQKSYYDHIIRNESDYLDIWNYIEGNPMK